MMTPIYGAVALSLFLLGVPPVAANQTDSLRCDEGLVSVGMDAQDVEDDCGDPAFVDDMQAVKTVRIYQRMLRGRHGDRYKDDHEKEDDGSRASGGRHLDRDYRLLNEERGFVRLEEWTYNFGSSRFIQTLAFENGQLVSITTGSYGFDKIPSEGSLVEKGDSKAVVFMKYGEPARRVTRPGTVAQVSYHEEGPYLYENEIQRPAVEEEWVYDFGPDKFLQKLSFKNNRLVEIRSLQRRGTQK